MLALLLDALIFLVLVVVSGWILVGASVVGILFARLGRFGLGLPVALYATGVQYGLTLLTFEPLGAFLAVLVTVTFWSIF